MSYRRRQRESAGGVRGPNSALTEFLREQGISAETIRRRHQERREVEAQEAEEEEEQSQDGQEEEELVAAAERKRNAADDSDEEVLLTDKNFCIDCAREFKITVYSKRVEREGKIGYLCPVCTQIQVKKERSQRKNQMEARKKRKKMAAALLDRQELKLPSLQDMCIKLISQNIEDVDVLGDIGVMNMKKISRILSKNRSLNDQTMVLFLETSLKELEFWDCSKIDSDSLNKIAAFCPNVEKLTLSMCGQLHNDNLKYFATNLKNLKYIDLNGPFLINQVCWQEFFEMVGQRLEGFRIANTHRFSSECLVSLLDNCGSGLKDLSLSRLDGLDEKSIYDMLPHYLNSLVHLEISHPHKEDLIDDQLLISILANNGETLESLVLDGCSNLTDEFLINGVKPFCGNLRKLSLGMLDQITDEGLGTLFGDWNINDGLMELSLKRCVSLTGASVYEALKHSSQTLIQMDLNSVYGLDFDFFVKWTRNLRLQLLTSLDLGFVRSCDDRVLAMLGRVCPKLTIVEIYGNNRCTGNANIRPGLRVIGRESDSI